MPRVVKERQCTQEDGTEGSWVTVEEDNPEETKSCHTSERGAAFVAAKVNGELDEEDTEGED
jgi:hypothetical protein